ncbi:MAG: hypothetical protein LBP22_07335 [Deltaproteobacteria bacterium]|jgi:hypothetical protein|nr:hypothetical protein [Deltaproteobacteria bacterium]
MMTTTNQDNLSTPPYTGILRTKSFYLAVGLFLLLAFLLAGPRLFLHFWLNRDLGQESYFGSVRAGEIRLGLFYQNLSVKDLCLVGQTPEQWIEVAEINITELSGRKFLKAMVGLDSWLEAAVDSKIEVREIKSPGGFDPFKTIGLKTLSLSLKQSQPETEPTIGAGLGAEYLKITDLILDSRHTQRYLSADSLSIFNYEDTVLGGLVISGLEIFSDDRHLELGGLTMSNMDVLQFISGILEPHSTPNLVNTVQSIELAGLAYQVNQKEALFLSQGFWENRTYENKEPDQSGDQPDNLVLNLKDLTVYPQALNLVPAREADPALKALAQVLGPQIKGELSFTLAPDYQEPAASKSKSSSLLNLTVRDQGLLTVSLSADKSFFRTLITHNPSLLTLATAGIGHGAIKYTDQGFLTNWSFALAQETNVSPQEALSRYTEPYWNHLANTGAFLNLNSLKAETELFLQSPIAISLTWNPPANFPFSSLTKGQKGLPQLSGDNTEEIAKYYSYVILKDLNLALTVNGRLPVLFQVADP